MNRLCSSVLWTLYHNDSADHPAGGDDVEVHGLLSSRGRQNRRGSQHLLQLEKSFVRLMVPLEKSGLLHELVQGKSLLAQLIDETADGRQAAGKFLHVPQSDGHFHPLDGLDLHRVALYAAF